MCLCYLSRKIRRKFQFQAPRTNSMLCRILCPRKQTQRLPISLEIASSIFFSEFHGQLGCSLPTRRLVLRNEDYYIKIRPSLESWLQKLLTRPEFRHSKLILDFIRNDERLVRVLKPYRTGPLSLYSKSLL